jgi:hypothetical protein
MTEYVSSTRKGTLSTGYRNIMYIRILRFSRVPGPHKYSPHRKLGSHLMLRNEQVPPSGLSLGFPEMVRRFKDL